MVRNEVSRSFSHVYRRAREVFSEYGTSRLVSKGIEFFLHSPVLWANFGSLSRWLSQTVELKMSPILLVSLPRSGSSWVGKMLGSSSSTLYLREPITQSVVRDTNLSVPFEVSRCDRSEVRAFARDAFIGNPSFSSLIVKEPERWSLTNREQKRLVIKEPNPFLLPWLADLYEFETVYLTRHPAAVAASFDRLGWNADELLHDLPVVRGKIKDRHLDSFWSWHGALQAIASRVAVRALHKQDHSYHIVKYESLCRKPVEKFQKLFGFAGLDWTEMDQKRIIQHTEATNKRRQDPYDTKRKSSKMLGAWRNDISDSQLRKLRKSFLNYGPYI